MHSIRNSHRDSYSNIDNKFNILFKVTLTINSSLHLCSNNSNNIFIFSTHDKIMFIQNVGKKLCNIKIDVYSKFGEYLLNVINNININNKTDLCSKDININLHELEQLYTNVINYLY